MPKTKAPRVNSTKTCWNCGKRRVKPVDSYFKCAACGATWNMMPNVPPPTVRAMVSYPPPPSELW